MKKETVRTFETRVKINSFSDEILQAFAGYFSKTSRWVFVKIQAGYHPNDLKSSYIKNYQITARQFNAMKVLTEGKMDSVHERRKGLIAEKKERIRSLEHTIKHFIKKEVASIS